MKMQLLYSSESLADSIVKSSKCWTRAEASSSDISIEFPSQFCSFCCKLYTELKRSISQLGSMSVADKTGLCGVVFLSIFQDTMP